RLQALVRSPHSYIPDTTVLLDYEHYIDPSLYSHFLGEFRITEVLADVLLHHIVKTIPQFCFGLIFATRENGNILDYRKRNIYILKYLFHLNIRHFDHYFLLLAGFRRFYNGLLNFHIIFHYFDNLGCCRWRWRWRGLYLFGHGNLFIQSILHVHGIIVIDYIIIGFPF